MTLTPGQIAYREYLKSDHWRMLRAGAFKAYGRRCARCPATCRLDVHHVRYPRLWIEATVQDLMILCRPCHDKEHGITPAIVTQVEKKALQKQSRNQSRKQWRKALKARNRRWGKKKRQKQQRSRNTKHFHVAIYKPFGRPRWVRRGNSSN